MVKLKTTAVILSGIFLCGATNPAPPQVLDAFIAHGRFDPGDFAYLKGRFAEASEGEKAEFQAMLDWSFECGRPAQEAATAELVDRGYDRSNVEKLSGGPAICFQPAFVPRIPDDTTFAEFREELAKVRPVYETYIAAIEVAESVTSVDEEDVADLLRYRYLGDQMARNAFSWGSGSTSKAPELSALGMEILRARMGMETMRRDRDNTEWLKAHVAEHGWPTISKVGEEASHKAWLLVQHADMDPVFQLDALELMKPLVPEGEVSGRNYAYLYDRVMLKLAGKQRYATQFECVDGDFAPQPVEDKTKVAHYRAEAGLDTLDENLQRMRDGAGRCN